MVNRAMLRAFFKSLRETAACPLCGGPAYLDPNAAARFCVESQRWITDLDLYEKYKRDEAIRRRPYHKRMPKIYCDGAGVPEHNGPWRASAAEPASADGACPRCALHAGVAYLFGIRVDDAENIGMERHDPRTRGVNLGLPGKTETVGYRPDGKPITRYRPVSSSEVNSNTKLRDYAKRHGLTPEDSGRYRSR